MENLIRFLIAWGPTILFVLIIILGIILGLLLGLRKSVLLTVQSFIVFVICLILFFVLVESKTVDALLLKLVNAIVGDNAMQRLFQVSTNCKTFREIFLEYIPKKLNFMDGLSLIAKENGAYLNSLIDMSYRVVFALVLLVLYNIIMLITIIITGIFFSERRKRKIINRKYLYGESFETFKKKRISGGIVYGCKGLVKALIVISFIGSAFFIFGGGLGNKNEESYDFEDNNYNLAYGAYQSIGSYGEQGIYKVLNTFKDKENTPYYLFAADLVFQGGLDDVNRNVSSNIYFRDELAAYVGFSRDTFDLLLKYGYDDIIRALNKNYTGDIMDLVIDIMAKEEFQEEFRNVITSFESKTYFVNLTLSLLDSITAHINEMGFNSKIPTSALEIMNILFVEDYKSSVIPYEKNLLDTNSDVKLSTIKASSLITKNDIYIAYDIFVDFIKLSNQNYESQKKLIIDLVKMSNEKISDLSILDSSRSNEINNVLKRLYAYIDIKFLNADSKEVSLGNDEAIYYNNSKEYDSIDWVDEINSIINLVDSGYTLYENNYSSETSVYNMILNAFDKNNSNYSENDDAYNRILYFVSKSKVIAEVLTTSLMEGYINNALSSISSDYKLPSNIKYNNSYDEAGNLIAYGELYNLLKGIRGIVDYPNIKDAISILNKDTITYDELYSSLEILMNALMVDENERPVDLLANSIVLRGVFTKVFTSIDFDGISIYIDESIMDQNKVINKDEFLLFIENGNDIIDVIKTITDNTDQNVSTTDKVISILDGEVIDRIIISKVLEGSISYSLPNLINSDTLIIPKTYKYVSDDDSLSDVRKFIDLKSSGIRLGDFINTDGNDNLTQILSIIKEHNLLTQILDIKILEYTISNLLITKGDSISSSFKIIVPNMVKEELVDDSIDCIIQKDELYGLLNSLMFIVDDFSAINEDSLTQIVNRLVVNSSLVSNVILKVTIVNALVSSDNIKNAITIPNELSADATNEKLLDFNKYNLWNTELPSLLEGLDILFDIKNNPELDITSNDSKDIIKNRIKSLNDLDENNEMKINGLLSSIILKSTLSSELDKAFLGVVEEDVLTKAKVTGTLYYNDSEYIAIIDALNILDIDFTNDIDKVLLEDKIANMVFDFAKPNAEYRNGDSALNLLYPSVILNSLITSSIDSYDLVGDSSITLEAKNKDGYYKKEEIEAILDYFEFIDINKNDSNEEMNRKINSGFTILLDFNPNHNMTELEYLYKYNLFGIIFGYQASKVTSVPQDAYDDDSYRVSYREAYSMIKTIDCLDLDMTQTINMSLLDLDSLDPSVVSESKIASAAIYDEFNSRNEIVIPYYCLNDNFNSSNYYINPSELNEFLTILKSDKEFIFGSPDENGKYQVNNINFSSKHSSITPDKIKNYTKSKILNATMVYNLNKSIISDSLAIPSRYENDANRDQLIKLDATKNAWTINNELYKLACAMEVLGIDSIKENSFEVELLDIRNLKVMLNNGGIYDSDIIASTITKSICDKILDENQTEISIDPMISSEVKYHYSIYDSKYEHFYLEEINRLIDALVLLEMYNISSINVDFNSVINLNNNRDVLYESIIVKGIITRNIVNNINKNSNVLADCIKAYEQNINIYKNNEIDSLIDLIKNENPNNDSFETFIENADSINIINVKNAIKPNEDGEPESYLITSIISRNIMNIEGIIIPQLDYDYEAGMIKANSLYTLLEACESCYITSIDMVVFEDMRLPGDVSKLLLSNIIKVNIVQSLEIKINNVIVNTMAEALYSQAVNDFRGHKFYSITDSEYENFIGSLKLLNSQSFNAQLNLTSIFNLTNDERNNIFKSSIIRTMINVLIVTTPKYNQALQYFELISVDVVIFVDNVVSNYQLLKNDDLNAIIVLIKNL